MVARRNMILVVLVAAIVVVAGVGIALYIQAPRVVPNQGVIIVDTAGDPQYLDPAIDYETAGGDVLQNVYETLLFYNMSSASQLLPVLCTSYNITDGGLTYTFTLRQGVTFHDGSQFNASVMKWSLDRVILMNNPDGPAWILNQFIRGGTNYTKSNMTTRTQVYEAARTYFAANGVEYVDQYTLRIHVVYGDNTTLNNPYGGTIYCLAYTVASAVSYNFVDSVGGGKAADTSSDNDTMSVARWNQLYHSGPAPSTLPYHQGRGVVPFADNLYMNEHTCGTGPYMMTEWTHATRIVMEAYTNYWGGPHNTGIAPTAKVIINDITDFNSRKLRILSGDSDMAYWGALYADQLIDLTARTVLPQYAADIRAVVDLPTFTVDHIQFNEKLYLPSGVTGVINCASVNGTMSDSEHTYYTSDGNLINASLNPFYYRDFRQACILAYNYTAYIHNMNGFVNRLNGYIPYGMVSWSDVPYVTQDMAAATALFAKVNWTGSVNYYYNTGNTARGNSGLIFHDYIMKASKATPHQGGYVTINVDQLTWPQFLGLMQARQCPVAHVGWAPDYADPDDYAIPYAKSGQTFSREIWFENSTIDDQVTAAATSVNTATRTAIYKDITLTLNKQAVYLWVGQGATFHVERTWVHGWFFNPMFSGFYYYYLTKS